jgi:DNA-binding transcriptional regulator YhcF (GntR family)
MTSLSIDLIFESVLRIHLFEENAIAITFSESGIRIKLPTTRKLAEFLDVPHYYVLPYFAMMEQEALVTRAERVGIMTTPSGTERYLTLLKERYPAEGMAILGPTIYTELTGRGSRD